MNILPHGMNVHNKLVLTNFSLSGACVKITRFWEIFGIQGVLEGPFEMGGGQLFRGG